MPLVSAQALCKPVHLCAAGPLLLHCHPGAGLLHTVVNRLCVARWVGAGATVAV